MDKTIYVSKKALWHSRNALLIAILIPFFLSCNQEPKKRLLFVGDILLSRIVKVEIDQKDRSPWAAMDSLFQSSDLVIGNLEGAVGDTTIEYSPDTKIPTFTIEKSDISFLKDAGFHALSLENNHSHDLGSIGRTGTYEALLSKDLNPLTFDNAPFFIEMDDLTISIIAINTIPDRHSAQQSIPSVDLERKIRMAATLSDMTIIYIHWGSELLEWPDKEQRRMAEWLTTKKVDLVIGSHPHIIQPPEIVNGKPVYFSLGNHLFDQQYKSTKTGLMAVIEITGNTISCTGIRTSLQENSFFPVLSGDLDFKFEFQFSKKSEFYNDDLDLSAVSFPESRSNQIILKSKHYKKTWRSKPINIESLEVFKDSADQQYLFMLKEVFSPIDREVSIRPYVYSTDETGLVAKWRGSALAWPLIDARIYDQDDCLLCALHRGDSFINLDKKSMEIKIAAYRWNGFGFNLLSDSLTQSNCQQLFTDSPLKY